MADQRTRAILDHPDFRKLVRRRGRLALMIALVMMIVWFGFILSVACKAPVLARPLGGGSIPVGLAAGLGVMLTAFGLTWLYVRRANREFDRLARRLVESLPE
ncbi:MAG: DUF485 domain-containing protein [Rhodospirillaceae bacterium]